MLFNGPDNAPVLALAHGAGGPMDSPFMDHIAHGLGQRNIRVVRFEFPYMAERRAIGRKRPPDRLNVLLDCWRAVATELGGRFIIGGKSMGGRMASMIADEVGALGLVCLGYPFYPIGKPEKPRVEHLAALKTPALFCQGTEDALGARGVVSRFALSPAIHLHWIEGADHSFKPRGRASGRSERGNREEALDTVAAFVHKLG